MAKFEELYLVLLIFLAQESLATAAVKTPQQLLKDLRNLQIRAMISEEKGKIDLNVPDHLATATFYETRTRVLKADSDIFEISASPYSPFKAEKSPKNLGYLGRGYDALFGNPLDEAGRVDPGFRLQAVELEYLQNRFSNDGEYRIPDNADVTMEPSALFSSTFNDVRTENDYKQQLKEDVKTTSGFGFGASIVSVSGEFSQSKSYQSTKESIKKGGKVNIDIVGRATAYKAYLHVLGDIRASKTLQNVIKDLPDTCPNPADLSPYYRVIQKFGTHFTTVVTMGAKAVQRLTMTTKESMELKQRGISTNQVVSATIGFSAKGVSANANFGHEKGSSSDTQVTDTLKKMNIQRREFYIGGEPPSLPYSQNYYYSVKLDGGLNDDPGIGSTESLREWGRSAFEKPVPIQYQLRPIMDLFQKSHLPDVDETKIVIDEKSKCMKKALNGYCAKVATNAGDCVSYDDGGSEPNAIRYGDLIAIQKVLSNNRAEYLVVPESNPKFAVGSTPEYMKVMPVDTNAYWKYGNALHYGEPFNLLSEYGGQQKIVSCGYGDNKYYAIFNYGKNDVKITCEFQGFPVDQWPAEKKKWCRKRGNDISSKIRTVRECQVDCVDELGDECVGIQYITSYKYCSYCKNTDQDKPVDYNFDLDTSPVFYYRRLDKNGELPQPQLTVTLYFASPTGKKQGDIVMENDKAYMGVTSYESRDSLYDVRRPAFLKAVTNTIHVDQDDGELNTDLDELRKCTSKPKDTHLECSFWWKILATQKTLRTYPNVHFEKQSPSPEPSSG